MKKRILLFALIISILTAIAGCSKDTVTSSTGGEKEVQSQKNDAAKDTQKTERSPEWIKSSTIYEVNWRQYTHEGTIKAFETHLPRLKDMGVDVLWFMPIYPIAEKKRLGTLGSYYAVKDYTDVNPEFGTLEEFKALVKKCHEMGFKVILDWVANHTGWDNKWISNKDWYTQNDKGEIVWPANTDWEDVADLNYDNNDMRQAMIASMKFWVQEVDIDGFRCDYASGVPQDFWEQAREELDKIKPVFMLAEDDMMLGLLDKAFNANYNWNLYHTMNDIAAGSKNASDARGAIESASIYPTGSFSMNFTSNHDENSWNGTEYERLKDAVKTMAVLSFTAPGIPLIYSGQEAALNKRLKFFDKDEISWSNTPLQDFYKQLIALKKNNKALWNGEAGGNITFLEASDNDAVLSFVREKDDNKVVIIMNLTSQAFTGTIKADTAAGSYKDFTTGETFSLQKEQSLTLKPYEYKILVK